jgi:hypothetical protein
MSAPAASKPTALARVSELRIVMVFSFEPVKRIELPRAG